MSNLKPRQHLLSSSSSFNSTADISELKRRSATLLPIVQIVHVKRLYKAALMRVVLSKSPHLFSFFFPAQLPVALLKSNARACGAQVTSFTQQTSQQTLRQNLNAYLQSSAPFKQHDSGVCGRGRRSSTPSALRVTAGSQHRLAVFGNTSVVVGTRDEYHALYKNSSTLKDRVTDLRHTYCQSRGRNGPHRVSI